MSIYFLKIQEFGVSQTRELKSGGQNLPVTEDNKKEYVKLVCQEKMTGTSALTLHPSTGCKPLRMVPYA